MKVIVTGGAGFIGSHLSEKLLKNKKIKQIIIIDHLLDGSKKNLKNILKNRRVKLVKVDICKFDKIERYFKGVTYVFHLAGIADIVPSIVTPKSYIDTNFTGTINILEAMRKYKVKKIIYAASSSCYGITKKKAIDEKYKISTMYPYSFSKYIAEQAIIHWSKVYKTNFISLRLFNVFGPRSRTTGAYGAVMGVFLKQKLSNMPFTVVGNGKQTRDFINVEDVASAFIKGAFSNIKNRVYNVGTGKPQSINYLTKLLNGKKVFIPRRPGEPYYSKANISKIKKELKWKPKITFENGVKELISNINYWRSAPLWSKEKIKNATKTWFKNLK
tara:strand:- start:2772 stop:3761 length:990 start_codon:yes stop_codon:yes gene_type:complete